MLPTLLKEVSKSIENLANVILRCPIYCLPTHILNASYSTKRSAQKYRKSRKCNFKTCLFYGLPTNILDASYSTKRRFGQQNDAPD